MKPWRLVVAGIGTDVGKTVASAALCQQLEADYWKPVASGTEDGPVDDEIIRDLVSGGMTKVHPCRYRFRKSLSPHIAGRFDNVEIQLDELQVPMTERPLVIELAGGVAVPLNDQHTNLDLVSRWRFPIVVVSRHYLGSINHTLLTIEALRARDLAVAGIIFNGDELPDTERIIERLGKAPILGRIPQLAEVSSASLKSVPLLLAAP